MTSRPKPAITDAIDSAVASVVAVSLRERGYRKVRRHWWHDSEGTYRAVTVQSSMSNSVASGGFTVELGFAYPSIGEARPVERGAWFCPHRVRIGQLLPRPHDLWWTYDDATDVRERTRNEADLARTWSAHGLPFLDRMDRPGAYLDHLLRDPTTTPVGLEAVELAERMGARPEIDRALDGVLAGLRSDRWVPRDAVLNPHPLGWLALGYAELLPHLRAADRTLDGADLRRARDAVAETLAAMAEGHQWERYLSGDRRELLVRLGDSVAVDARLVLGARVVPRTARSGPSMSPPPPGGR